MFQKNHIYKYYDEHFDIIRYIKFHDIMTLPNRNYYRFSILGIDSAYVSVPEIDIGDIQNLTDEDKLELL